MAEACCTAIMAVREETVLQYDGASVITALQGAVGDCRLRECRPLLPGCRHCLKRRFTRRVHEQQVVVVIQQAGIERVVALSLLQAVWCVAAVAA